MYADLGIEGLDSMDEDGVRAVLELYVANYVYERWLNAMLEDLTDMRLSEEDLVRAEQEVKAFIRETVRLMLHDVPVTQTDWNGKEGERIAMDVFEQAYAVWEADQP